MIELVQLSTGIHWRPEIIHLNMPENRAVDACSLFKKSEICFSQPISAISIECDLLQLPVHIEIPIREISHKSNAKIDTDFLSAIQQIVSSYTQTKIISVEEVAGIAELSVRSLQRRLRRNGVKFNDLLSQAKFVHAKSKLRETQIPIKEIARLLGYSDPAHFTRAFKSWSGSTPTDFRKGQH